MNSFGRLPTLFIIALSTVVLSPTHVGRTAHISDGHFDQNGLLLTVLQGGVENETAQVQGPMCAYTALREKLEELKLLNRPFLFPCIITILTGTRCCLFWKQELTSAPSQETTWDCVARSSRRASNLKYLPPAFLYTPIFGKVSRFSKLREEYRDLFAVQPRNLPPANGVDLLYPHHYDDDGTGEKVSFTYNERLDSCSLLQRLRRSSVSSSSSLGSMEETRIVHAPMSALHRIYMMWYHSRGAG